MKIIGFNFTKIYIEKEQEIQEKNFNITQNLKIEDLKEEEIPISKNKSLILKFVFSVEYSNNIGKLEFIGNVIILPEKNELSEFKKEWKEKRIPQNLQIPLFNFIIAKCNAKALFLEEELNLPFHFPTPQISEKRE